MVKIQMIKAFFKIMFNKNEPFVLPAQQVLFLYNTLSSYKQKSQKSEKNNEKKTKQKYQQNESICGLPCFEYTIDTEDQNHLEVYVKAREQYLTEKTSLQSFPCHLISSSVEDIKTIKPSTNKDDLLLDIFSCLDNSILSEKSLSFTCLFLTSVDDDYILENPSNLSPNLDRRHGFRPDKIKKINISDCVTKGSLAYRRTINISAKWIKRVKDIGLRKI